ncbi:MAG: isopentenyl-diphosphate Delta-isomerase [Gammaproteobacteria bacterium]|nr:isopentenyl-diphosphate Delta-isomerase [Gammaproteobacteria bacterium]
MRNKVILVDKNDQQIGTMDKLSAHIEDRLHRAFSIFIFNHAGELLLQQRAHDKYHSGGLWSNTCCSHPTPGELTIDAAHRRLQEEMGFDCPLQEQPSLTYRAELDNGLTENEFDHIFFGRYKGNPVVNTDEAIDWQWMTTDTLLQSIKKQPESFTSWLKLITRQNQLNF